jgi:hypothetical protein
MPYMIDTEEMRDNHFEPITVDTPTSQVLQQARQMLEATIVDCV